MSEELELPPREVSKLAESGDAQLVDVRTDEEWEAGRIAEARHMPLESLSAQVEELDQSKPVVLYCRGGDRSSSAAQALAASGWDARHLAGGLSAWAEAGLPLEPANGEVSQPSGLPPE
jgi:rhodanese-related sulfurtransferase